MSGVQWHSTLSLGRFRSMLVFGVWISLWPWRPKYILTNCFLLFKIDIYLIICERFLSCMLTRRQYYWHLIRLCDHDSHVFAVDLKYQFLVRFYWCIFVCIQVPIHIDVEKPGFENITMTVYKLVSLIYKKGLILIDYVTTWNLKWLALHFSEHHFSIQFLVLLQLQLLYHYL